MNRRNLFKLLAGAVCAAAVEVTGLKPVAAPDFTQVEYDLFHHIVDLHMPRYEFTDGKWVEVPYYKITSDQV